jgi:hypothetical protein
VLVARTTSSNYYAAETAVTREVFDALAACGSASVDRLLALTASAMPAALRTLFAGHAGARQPKMAPGTCLAFRVAIVTRAGQGAYGPWRVCVVPPAPPTAAALQLSSGEDGSASDVGGTAGRAIADTPCASQQDKTLRKRGGGGGSSGSGRGAAAGGTSGQKPRQEARSAALAAREAGGKPASADALQQPTSGARQRSANAKDVAARPAAADATARPATLQARRAAAAAAAAAASAGSHTGRVHPKGRSAAVVFVSLMVLVFAVVVAIFIRTSGRPSGASRVGALGHAPHPAAAVHDPPPHDLPQLQPHPPPAAPAHEPGEKQGQSRNAPAAQRPASQPKAATRVDSAANPGEAKGGRKPAPPSRAA